MAEGTNWKGDKSAYTYNSLGLRVNNTQTAHAGKVCTRDYVIDYTSFENDDLMVFAEGNGQLEYEQKHVYAESERIEQFTDEGNWERTLYVHEDVMGNPQYYTKANGQSFAELTYDAWGMPQSPNKLLNNDHGNYVFATFTGHIYDTTLDIYFAEARFYDADNRTWLAMDPIKDGGNWYQYCYGDPIKYFDPNGLLVFVVGYELAEAMGVRIGAGTQLAIDWNGNVGILDYKFTGGGFPSVGIGGLSIGLYNAEEIWDLDGMGGSVGGGGNLLIMGTPVSVSGDYIVGLARDGSMVWGITLSVSGEAAFPIEMHGEWMVSKVYKLFNIPEEIENVKKLYRAAKSIFQALSHC